MNAQIDHLVYELYGLTEDEVKSWKRRRSETTEARAEAHHRVPWSANLMMIKEHDCVVLTEDLPSENLKAGDIGTIIHIHGKHKGYEVEFMTLAGETLAVVTLLPPQVRPITRRDLAHVRKLATV